MNWKSAAYQQRLTLLAPPCETAQTPHKPFHYCYITDLRCFCASVWQLLNTVVRWTHLKETRQQGQNEYMKKVDEESSQCSCERLKPYAFCTEEEFHDWVTCTFEVNYVKKCKLRYYQLFTCICAEHLHLHSKQHMYSWLKKYLGPSYNYHRTEGLKIFHQFLHLLPLCHHGSPAPTNHKKLINASLKKILS